MSEWEAKPVQRLVYSLAFIAWGAGLTAQAETSADAIAKIARRKLDMLDAAHALEDLRVPPGNRLERLRGDRAGQLSIRVNDQWRLCFVWTEDGPEDVEMVDYH